MSKKVFKCKDFQIVSVYIGSPLQNAPQWGYEIWYHGSEGKDIRLNGTFHTKAEAKKHISKITVAANMIHAKKMGNNQ